MERPLLYAQTRIQIRVKRGPESSLTRSSQQSNDKFEHMQQSMFNVRVPLADRGEVFLMNTLTDAQLIVSDEIAGCSIVYRAIRRRSHRSGSTAKGARRW